MAQQKTFQNQGILPRLPVPDLKNTCELYLKSLLPLCSPEEHQRNVALVQRFARPGGLGETLQKRLVEYDQQVAAQDSRKSWLEDWWFKYAYLTYREPSAINVNWYLVAKNHPSSMLRYGKIDQIRRAAIFTLNALQTARDILVEQNLAPEYNRKTPLCMDQMTRIFASSRIPVDGCDKLVTFPLEQSRHVTVICNDNFYNLNLFKENSNTPLTLPELHFQLSTIRTDAHAPASQHALPLGALTADHRDLWARARKSLEDSSERNRANLHKIDSSLFVLILDDSSPNTLDDVAQHTFSGGDGRCRWFDKAIQVIVYANGKIGVNGEHGQTDAPAPALAVDLTLMKETERQYALLASPPDQAALAAANYLPAPEKLKFDVPMTVIEAVRNALTANWERSTASQLHILEFGHFGADAIKRIGLSPDSFVQMALQAAYYRIHHHLTAVYETASTRQFSHGRTETCRSLSSESAAFSRALSDSTVPADAKFGLLKKAVASHLDYLAKGSVGAGCDRHLLGLRLLARDEERNHPDFEMFKDAKWGESQTWRVSSSNMSSGKLLKGGFGNVDPHGYGTCYFIRNDSIDLSIAATREKGTDVEKFGAVAEQIMREMMDLGVLALAKVGKLKANL